MRESHLLWIPRILTNLPLPYNWVQLEEDLFLSISENIEIKFHPIEPFIFSFIEKARNYYINN